MNAKKYLVCPGYVHSIRDGDRHFVTAARLIELYGVNPSECYIRAYGEPPLRGVDASTLTKLVPKVSGDYTLKA